MYVTDCHRRDTAFISCKMQDTTYHRKCPPFFCVNARHNHRRVILTEWCVSFRTRRKWPEAFRNAALKSASPVGLATCALCIHFIFESLNSTPYSSTIELLHRHLPCVDSVRQERMEYPGIVLCYAADAVVHAAAGEPGSPVPQGSTPAVSAERLREFIFRAILGTPLGLAENCVVEKMTEDGVVYFKTLFQRMDQDLFHSVVQRVTREFMTNQTATAQWSRRVSRDPASALVKLVRVSGGAGRGSVFMTVQYFGAGIFRQ